jgi:hypothetical protein
VDKTSLDVPQRRIQLSSRVRGAKNQKNDHVKENVKWLMHLRITEIVKRQVLMQHYVYNRGKMGG